MRILRENTVAVMIDVQYRLFPHISNFEQLELNILRMIQGLKVLNIPIYVTEQYTKGLGVTLPSLQQELMDDYKPIEKMTFSCCGSEDFVQKMIAAGKMNVILFGIESHVCVLQTTLDLLDAGYNVTVVENCCSSRSDNDHNIAMKRILRENGRLTTYESILFELCKVSGTDEFKAVSKIIK